MAAANSGVMVTIITLRLKGQVVGEWSDTPLQPGMRLGWSPAPMGLLAYVDAENHLALMDRQGRKLRVPGTASVLLPAWSLDGRQIVYLQKKNPKTYLLMVAGLR
jgi:hypothetical protein